MKDLKLYCLIFLCIISINLFAQNLIPNGSFEEFKPIKSQDTTKRFADLVGGWEAFSNSVTKHNKPRILVCKNCESIPDGEVEIHFDNLDFSNGKEFIKAFFQVPLTKELVKDSIYSLSLTYNFWIPERHSDDLIIDSRAVQFYLSNKKLKNIADISLLPKDSLWDILPKNKRVSFYGGKQKLNCAFKAKGGEKYLVFGTFSNKYLKYFFSLSFDDIKLMPSESMALLISETEVGSSFVMDNILFETDKSNLKKTSYKALNQIITELNKNPKLKLEISGHTDNVGTVEHNQQLSEQRAKSVVDYLIKSGINSERLTHKGYGS